MKISHIRISNILGIDSLEFSPEGFTAITGPNGAGKTSILEAIKAATGAGHDATLLRKGAEKGEVVLVLDDGTEIQQRVTPTRTTRDVVRDGKKVTRPGNVIKSLTDALSVNPVEFLTARKQDRVKVLLESMPIKLDVEKLSKVSGIPVHADTHAHALHVIEAVRQQVYDDRTGTNRAIKEKDATINQLRLAMPDAPGGVDGDEDELHAKLEQLTTARAAETQRIDTKLASVRKVSAETVQRITDDLQARIDALRASAQAEIDAERARLSDTESKAARVRQRAIDACADKSLPLQQAISAIRANRDAAAKRKATAETIAQMTAEADELRQDAERQIKALNDIDAYKTDLLASLPIPGVEVRDGEVFRDGVPFDRLNTSQKVSIAIEISKLRAGNLKCICVDGLELMDPMTFKELQAQFRDCEFQMFVTRVSGGEFSVTSE